MLVDSHCHLDFPDFADELDAVVARARAAGVGTMLTIGTKISQFPGVLAVAERFQNVFCTVGIHPHEAATEPTTTAADLMRLAEHPKVVGFGETGLDFYYEHSPRDAQERCFRTHAEAARKSKLPLIVHSRDADVETARILEEEQGKGPFTGVVHCFTGGPQLANSVLSLGFHISFSGIVTFKKADQLRAIAREVPADRMLVETDSPYLAPVPERGKRNEPAFTTHTAAFLANLRGVPAAEFNRTTTANFFNLFTKAKA